MQAQVIRACQETVDWPQHTWVKQPLAKALLVVIPISHNIEPSSIQPINCREKICKLSYCTVKKVLGPKEISQPVDPAKDMRTPREFDFGVQWILIIELPQDWETECWGWGTAKTLCTSVARSGEQGFQKRLGQACL